MFAALPQLVYEAPWTLGRPALWRRPQVPAAGLPKDC